MNNLKMLIPIYGIYLMFKSEGFDYRENKKITMAAMINVSISMYNAALLVLVCNILNFK